MLHESSNVHERRKPFRDFSNKGLEISTEQTLLLHDQQI